MLLPLAGAGFFGLAPDNYAYPPSPALLVSLGLAAFFALLLGGTPRREATADAGRRKSLKSLALFAAVAAARLRLARAAEDLGQRIRGPSPRSPRPRTTTRFPKTS